jgi:hypothetical protein
MNLTAFHVNFISKIFKSKLTGIVKLVFETSVMCIFILIMVIFAMGRESFLNYEMWAGFQFGLMAVIYMNTLLVFVYFLIELIISIRL